MAMLSHEQAQELHEYIGQATEQAGDWRVALERAQELAAILVSDTMEAPPYPLGESVTFLSGNVSDKETPATAWMELGDLSVCLTRRTDTGRAFISLESHGDPVEVDIALQEGTDIWSGVV